MKKPVNIAAAKARPLVKRVRRIPGRGAGQWKISPDFNAPLLPEVLQAFDGNS